MDPQTNQTSSQDNLNPAPSSPQPTPPLVPDPEVSSTQATTPIGITASQDTSGHSGPRPVFEKPMPKKAKKGLSSQNTLQVSEIRDGMVIMRDGSLRAAIMCQSINFDLMSQSEREAVES